MKHFTGSYVFTIIGFVLAWFWAEHVHQGSGLAALFIVLILSILEISLSFDNAVVNAVKLEKMSPKWQHRFLTWGILIAVFGMRFLFPICIVSIFSKVNVLKVIDMALNDADKYSYYLQVSHPAIITFGGAFLIMLFISYFFNHEKELHWIGFLEKKMASCGHFKSIGIIIALFCIYLTQLFAPVEHKHQIMAAGICGMIVYLLIDGFSHHLEAINAKKKDDNTPCHTGFSLKNSCFVNFLYLELIDASFSLDGVLGAFALSKDVVIITLGLAIGAMFVRSLTLFLVEKKTLKEYKYLEHGAHWAIGALAVIMFISANIEVSEIITGLIGFVFILVAFITSLIENKKAA